MEGIMQLIDVTCTIDEIISNYKFQSLNAENFTLIKQSLLINGLNLALFNIPVANLNVKLTFTHDNNYYIIEKTCESKSKIISRLYLGDDANPSLLVADGEVDEKVAEIVGDSYNNLKYKFVSNSQMTSFCEKFTYRFFDKFVAGSIDNEYLLEKETASKTLEQLMQNPPPIVSNQEIDKLNQEIDALKASVAAKTKQPQTAKVQTQYINSLKQQIADNDIDIIAEKEHLRQINEKLSQLTTQHQDLIKQAAQMRIVIETISNNNINDQSKQNLEDTAVLLAAQLSALNSQRDDINSRIISLTALMSETSSKLSSQIPQTPIAHMLAASGLHSQIIEAENNQATYQKQLIQLNQQLISLEGKNTEKTQFTQQIIKLDNVISPLKAKVGFISVLDTEINKLTRQLQAYQDKKDNLSKEIVSLDNKLSEYDNLINNLSKKINEQRYLQQQLLGSHGRKEADLNIAADVIKNLVIDYENAQRQRSDIENTISGYNSKIDEITRYCSSISSDIKRNNQQRTSILTKYRQIISMSTNENNYQYFKALEENVSTQYVTDVISGNLALQAQINQCKQSITDCEGKIVDCANKISQLKDEYKQYDPDFSYDSMVTANNINLKQRTEAISSLDKYTAETRKLYASLSEIDKAIFNLKQNQVETINKIQQLEIHSNLISQLTSRYDADIHTSLSQVNETANKIQSQISELTEDKEKQSVKIALIVNNSKLATRQYDDYTSRNSQIFDQAAQTESLSSIPDETDNQIKLLVIKRDKLLSDLKTFIDHNNKVALMNAKLQKLSSYMGKDSDAIAVDTRTIKDFVKRANHYLSCYLPQYVIEFKTDLVVFDTLLNDEVQFSELTKQQQVLIYICCANALDDNKFIIINNEINLDRKQLMPLCNCPEIFFATKALSITQ